MLTSSWPWARGASSARPIKSSLAETQGNRTSKESRTPSVRLVLPSLWRRLFSATRKESMPLAATANHVRFSTVVIAGIRVLIHHNEKQPQSGLRIAGPPALVACEEGPRHGVPRTIACFFPLDSNADWPSCQVNNRGFPGGNSFYANHFVLGNRPRRDTAPCAGAAIAKPAIYEGLEERGAK
jgi:hypothetical protein